MVEGDRRIEEANERCIHYMEKYRALLHERKLRVWTASYYVSYGYGAYDEHDAVVVANTEFEALGFLLERFSDTYAEHWTLEEVDTATPHVHD